MDPRQEGAVKLSHILLVSDLDRIAEVINNGLEDSSRVCVLLVRFDHATEKLLHFHNQLYRRFDPFLSLFINYVILFLFLLCGILFLKHHYSMNKGGKGVVDLEQRVEVACCNYWLMKKFFTVSDVLQATRGIFVSPPLLWVQGLVAGSSEIVLVRLKTLFNCLCDLGLLRCD